MMEFVTNKIKFLLHKLKIAANMSQQMDPSTARMRGLGPKLAFQNTFWLEKYEHILWDSINLNNNTPWKSA